MDSRGSMLRWTCSLCGIQDSWGVLICMQSVATHLQSACAWLWMVVELLWRVDISNDDYIQTILFNNNATSHDCGGCV